jgi:hypothetical protein
MNTSKKQTLVNNHPKIGAIPKNKKPRQNARALQKIGEITS